MKKRIDLNKDIGQTLTEPMYLLILECIKLEHSKKLELLIPLLHSADCADLLERLDPAQREIAIPAIQIGDLGDVLANLNAAVREQVLETIDPHDLARALYEIESDDIAEIISVLEIHEQENLFDLIGQIDPNERMHVQHVRNILSYPDDSAGRLMKSEVLTVPRSWSVQKLNEYITAESENLPDKISSVFVTDRSGQLVGSMSLHRIVRSKTSSLIKDCMRKDPLSINVYDDVKHVQKIFEKYDLFTCAIVDNDNKLVGQITIDDVLDLALQQGAEEVLQMAGLSHDEDLFLPASQTALNRLPWLVLNLFTAVLASFVISLFEDQIQQVVALAVLMPIVASMGGNAGTQTLTIIIRGMATDQITTKNAGKLLRKELFVGSFNGIVLGFMLSLATYVFYKNEKLALVILTATILNHIVSAFAGHLLPIILKRCGKDPAVSSGIFLTTVTDVVGFFAFLGLASLILI